MLSRRDLLKLGLAGSGYALLGGGAMLLGPGRARRAYADALASSPKTTPFMDELPIAAVAQPTAPFTPLRDPGNCVNVDGTRAFHVGFHGPDPLPANTQYFLIHEMPGEHSFHSQLPPNTIWGYNGTAPGPTFMARSVARSDGAPFLVRFVNDLQRDAVGIGEPITAIHRHGGFQLPEDDGYPLDTFCGPSAATGGLPQSRDYFYPNEPDDGEVAKEHSTLWYHDHAIDITGENVYRGLAGFYLNHDNIDTGNEQDPPPALGLPSGEFDIPMVVQDRLFNRKGFLVFDNFDHNGFLGDKFLVNGKIQPFLKVARRKYRFRFLNGSNARFFQLFLSSGQRFIAIATDSHLLPRPVRVRSFRFAPAERVEVVVDFSKHAIGDEILLVNRLEQNDGRKPGELVSPGTPILKFIVDRDAPDPSRVPDPDDPHAVLRPQPIGPRELLPHVKVRRTFKFERSDGAWVINGEFFDENRISGKPKRNSAEIWTLESGGGWAHPVHIHLTEFFVLSRNGSTPPPLERGLKETIEIGAGVGDVELLVPFPNAFSVFPRPATGRYVFHCHNIEHEDMRMMAQFEVQP